MKITILTVGSRGDIEPFVALGEGLQASGHVVSIATEIRFEKFLTERGLQFCAVPGDTYAAMNSEECQKALNKKDNTEAFFSLLTAAAAPLAKQILLQNIEACRGAEHIITTPWCLHTGYFIAQQLSVPMSVAAGNATVLSDTRYFSNLMLPLNPDWLPQVLLEMYNSFSHKVVAQQWWKSYTSIYAHAWKEATGFILPKQDPIAAFAKSNPLLLYGYSPFVLPKPADWGSNQHVTGYWTLKADENWQPSSELKAFIESGPAPIYIGFGSMNNSLLKQGMLENMILETVSRTKQRAVILKQGLNLEHVKLPEYIFAAEPVPFNYLFSKMAVLVHHGGAGTTALGLKSGVPAVYTPLIVDQKFWSRRVYETGASVKPLPWYNLTTNGLVKAIDTTVADAGIRRNAAELGKKISQENGVENAVAIFNQSL